MSKTIEQAVWTTNNDKTSFIWKLFERAKNLPESVPAAIRKELTDLSAEVNGKKDELNTKDTSKTAWLLEQLKEKAKLGLQKYVREWKTAELKNNKKLERILANAQSFDGIKAGDILQLKKQGVNIANFLLSDEDGDEIDFQKNSIDTFKNKKLLINFWENKSINNQIGLWDILPYEVRKIEITKPDGTKVIGTLGTIDSRKGRKERVWYYDQNGVYIAIYSGYTISILETGSISAEEKKKLETIQMNHLEKIRMDEMIEYIISKNGFKKVDTEEWQKLLETYYRDGDDRSLFEKAITLLNARVERGDYIRNAYKDGIGSQEKFIGKFGWYMRDIITRDFPNVPPYMLVNLFRQESGFDPTIRTKNGTAYWLWQITDETWGWIKEHLNNSYDRDSPYDQIHASAAYLDWIMRNNKCDTIDAIIYYHMGPNVKKLMDSNNQEKLSEYIEKNPAVAKYMTERNWQWYWNAARDYYLKQPNLLTSLDLSKTGTELATQLGDFVMSTNLPDTWSASCGKAVGILLNRFWIEELPQTGRDGKNWDDILEPRIKKWQFKKVPIAHPDEAWSWAVLIYDGSWVLWSDANKTYGHVEIKWSDGKYYSYYEGSRAGWSAANAEKDPKKYADLTGFIWYAYYPKQTKSI
jgi:hypothetical protein